jgi:hypothetical protein
MWGSAEVKVGFVPERLKVGTCECDQEPQCMCTTGASPGHAAVRGP